MSVGSKKEIKIKRLKKEQTTKKIKK